MYGDKRNALIIVKTHNCLCETPFKSRSGEEIIIIFIKRGTCGSSFTKVTKTPKKRVTFVCNLHFITQMF